MAGTDRRRIWVVAPSRYAAWLWFSKNKHPEVDYRLVWNASAVEGAHMAREDLVFVHREHIDPQLLNTVNYNLIRGSSKRIRVPQFPRLPVISYVENGSGFLILNAVSGQYKIGQLELGENHPRKNFFQHW